MLYHVRQACLTVTRLVDQDRCKPFGKVCQLRRHFGRWLPAQAPEVPVEFLTEFDSLYSTKFVCHKKNLLSSLESLRNKLRQTFSPESLQSPNIHMLRSLNSIYGSLAPSSFRILPHSKRKLPTLFIGTHLLDRAPRLTPPLRVYKDTTKAA